ncbi:MAG: hypothetical protein PHV98_00650 [Candidatus Omnitrophica bacterium]|nr:hypothetical protein [Candidatus Omnitrophota bacterium]
MEYTQRFTEGAALLAKINPASHTTEQNTGYVSLANYHRAAIIIHAGVLGADLDVDIEEGTTTGGAGAQSFDSGGKDITIHNADDNTVSVIEIRTEECDVSNGYDCINVEATPGGASIFGIQVWGLEPRFKPVPTTGIDSITD